MLKKTSYLVLAAILVAGCTLGPGSPSPASTLRPEPTYPEPVATAAVQPTLAHPATSGPDAQPRSVIVDTDMAVDDWMALLYLLQHPAIQIEAITVDGAGEAHCEQGIRNATGLVALSGHAPIPVACGRETPLQGDHTFPAGWRESVDGMLGLALPEGQNPADSSSAVDLLLSLLPSLPDQVTVLTLGPLTNMAELVQAAPDIVDKIEMVYVMGGAVHVPGNLDVAGIPNQAAEWNMYIDPSAANVVFASGVPVTIVPLDATNQVPLNLAFYQSLEVNQQTPEAAFVYQVLTNMRGLIDAGSYYFWDPLAAGIMVHEDLASFEQDPLCVVEEEGPESGLTRIDAACPEVRVAIAVDEERFTPEFLDTLNALSAQVEPEVPPIDPLVGTWTGSAWNGDFEMQAAITITETCQLGQLCGQFDLSIACSGTLTWVGMEGNLYKFQAGDKSEVCGEGSDYLEPQTDGTVLYISRGDYGETRGVLQRAP